MATVNFGSIYPGRPSGQERTNPPDNTTNAAVRQGNVMGMSIPMLVAMGVLAWYLLQVY